MRISVHYPNGRVIHQGYRLLFHLDGALVSVVYDGVHPRLHYPERKWVTPPKGGGPLAVFSSKTKAKAWGVPWLQVWRCWYAPSTSPVTGGLWRPNGKIMRERLPKGTVLADAVMITERVG